MATSSSSTTRRTSAPTWRRTSRGLGHRVEIAADGAEALRRADAEPFDVVLSDVRMAGMDGLALLREIRRRRPDAVVVLMTAYATIPGAVEAMREGAFDYLVKPFALDEVGLLVERALEVARAAARQPRAAPARSTTRRCSSRARRRCSARSTTARQAAAPT